MYMCALGQSNPARKVRINRVVMGSIVLGINFLEKHFQNAST